MMIDEHRMNGKESRLKEQKEIKVKIPLDYHVRLHTTKVIDGQSISETVQLALAKYFATIGVEHGAPASAGAAGAVAAPVRDAGARELVAPLRSQ